jgi:hypothetical protein
VNCEQEASKSMSLAQFKRYLMHCMICDNLLRDRYVLGVGLRSLAITAAKLETRKERKDADKRI